MCGLVLFDGNVSVLVWVIYNVGVNNLNGKKICKIC